MTQALSPADASLPPGIELRLLRYFLAVAEELHFGRAAERLGMTQPPLSSAIRQLEGELGVALFTRTSRSVALTGPGAVFAHEARKALRSCAVAVAECRRAAAEAELRLGCPPDLPLQRTQAFLGALYEHDPESRIEVAHLHSSEQLRRLQAGELDLAIVHAPRSDGAFEMQPLFRGEPLVALLPVEHGLASSDGVGPDQLRGRPLITVPRAQDPTLHDRLLAAIYDAGYSFTAVREAPGADPRDALLAVAEGLGIALAPRSMVEVLGEARQIVAAHRLRPPAHMPDTVLAWRSDPSPRLTPALAAVRAAAGKLYR